MSFEDGEVQEGRDSKFNAGILLTQRVNDILKLLNLSKNNELAFSYEYQDYNFNLIIRNVNSLFNEIFPFIAEDEAAECLKLRKKINDVMLKFPILETKRTPNGSKTKPNKENWEMIRVLVDIFERRVRDLGVQYKILAATVDDSLEGL